MTATGPDDDNPADLPQGRLVAVTHRIDEPDRVELDVVLADSTRLHVHLTRHENQWLVESRSR